MAQDTKTSLLDWLRQNELDFMKNALVNAKYTLEMISDMTEDDMNGIFDQLKISPLERPRFRTAVKLLKQKLNSTNTVATPAHNTITTITTTQGSFKESESKCMGNSNYNSDDSTPSNDKETLESLLSVEDSQTIGNPCVIISTIEDYSQSKWKGKWSDLPGVVIDVANMVNLWKEKYKYTNVSIGFNTKSMNDSEIFMIFWLTFVHK